MFMMGMGICSDCRQVRYLAPNGACERCLKQALTEAARSDPEELRGHPDLAEFDDYAEHWYR